MPFVEHMLQTGNAFVISYILHLRMLIFSSLSFADVLKHELISFSSWLFLRLSVDVFLVFSGLRSYLSHGNFRSCLAKV